MSDIPENKPAKVIHTELERRMSTRHLRMISLGGVIGTGLCSSAPNTSSTRRACS